MKRVLALLLCAALLPMIAAASAKHIESRTLEMDIYRDKVRGAWLGKMVGVSIGIQREFWYRGEIGPENGVPAWNPALLSVACIEDDLYLPFVMLQLLDARGFGLSAREMAIALYPYSFEFWNGHLYTWECGIAPPDAGHPQYAPFPDALSYSFAADYSGLIAPGRPDIPVALADRFAPLLVYGDGVYAGAYIGALYSEAFFTCDMIRIVTSALEAVPPDSWLAESIRDVLDYYLDDPADWEAAWQRITQKYFLRMDYNWIQWPYGGRIGGINLDAKLNCAYMTIALLYGQGDPERTLSLAIRSGQDCDSNAANALGILFTTIGWDSLPETYRHAVPTLPDIRYADAGFEDLVEVTERVASAALSEAGARFIWEDGIERLVIPTVVLPRRQAENSKKPSPLVMSFFSPDEMSRMHKPQLQDGGFEDGWHEAIYPPWMVSGAGESGLDLHKGKAYAGNNNAWLSAAANSKITLSQHRIFVEPNARYELSCAVRTSAGFGDGFLAATEAGEGGASLGSVAFSSQPDYAVVALAFENDAYECIDIKIGYTSSERRGWVQVDEVVLRRVY